MRRRRIYTVQPIKGEPGWWEWVRPDSRLVRGVRRLARQRCKADLVRVARWFCRARPPAQLRIKGRDGKIQTEHTYGADPRRHEG